MFRRGIAILASALVMIAFTLAGAEIGCRLMYDRITKDTGRKSVDLLLGNIDEASAGQFRPHPYGLYVNTPGWEADGRRQNNSLGYRGAEFTVEKPKGVIRILALGSSTTYNFPAVKDPAKTWPAQLEKLLNDGSGRKVQVINAGLNAGTSGELLAQYVFKHRYLKPDIIIFDAGWADAAPMLIADYHPDYEGYRTWRGTPIVARAGEKSLLKASYLFRVIYAWWLDAPKFSELVLFPKGYAELTQAEAWQNERKNKPLGYERNLDALLTLAKADGVKVILFSEPTAPPVIVKRYHDKWAQEVYLPMRAAYERIQQVTRNKAKAYHVPLVEMRQDSIPVDYFFDNVHVDERGDTLKAEFMLPTVENVVEHLPDPQQ